MLTSTELSVVFFLQLFTIVSTCRFIGWMARRWLGQPQVVGEMIAGLVLGPSVFGQLLPDLQGMIFPAESKGTLFLCAQLGVALYMFIVGLGFRSDHFREYRKSAVAVSASGLVVPFLAAALLVPWLITIPGLFGDAVTAAQATLFLGAAISITAFPMLARIIAERGLSDAPVGTLSLSAGAMTDAGAWTVLAIVLVTFGDGMGIALTAMIGGTAFAVIVLKFGPRLLAPLDNWARREGRITPAMIVVSLMLFLLAASAMEAIGLHSVLGGFLVGAVMPRGMLTDTLRAQLEPLTVLLLLPIFFTYSGLNTQLALVNSPALTAAALAILLVSILAKGGACWVAARLTGWDNRLSLAIGALMNARGMMELIIINIGLQRGIIGPALFSILVLMAVGTTFMASPLLGLVYGRRARSRGELKAPESHQERAS